MIFHVTLEQAEDGWIVAECPALPGCVSQGKDGTGGPGKYQGSHHGLALGGGSEGHLAPAGATRTQGRGRGPLRDGAVTNMHLVIVHVGPVQDFIAAARRSRDLWFGSWMLSELSKAAALEIVRQNGNDIECLIFPAPSNFQELQSEDFNVANKVVAMLKESPEELGKSVRDAILDRLHAIRNEAYKKVKGRFDRTTAEEQVNDVLEFFWAACSVNGEYGHAREVAECLLAARKATRDFTAVTWGSSIFKSSLDGQRESVIPEPVYDQIRDGQMTKERLRRDYGVRVGERLCGVGLLKRHGKRGSGDDRFFSTSHVAALPLLKRLTDETATKKYIESLKQLGILSDELGNVPTSHPAFERHDGHLLFEERLSEFFEEEDKLKNAKEALHEFRRAALDNKSAIPYYALLLADGDRMGKAIDAQETAEQHRALSQTLTRFARSAAVIVKDYEGSLVYSGGDDLLAFVPLHTVLVCARCLSDTFRQELATFKVLEGVKQTSPTLSVGIVVAHHLDPLSDALTLARAGEKAAKSVDGKNALAVTVSKRSGADRTVKGPWGNLDQRLEWFIKLHRTDAIPDGAAYEFRDLAQRLDEQQLQAAMMKEAVRILRRKEPRRGQEAIANDVRERLERYITAEGASLKELADELIIAREFAAAQELAMVPLLTEVNP